MAKGIRFADHAANSTCKSQHYFTGSSGQSVGIVHLWIKNHGVCLVVIFVLLSYPNILTVDAFSNALLALYHDFDLHSGDEKCLFLFISFYF
jgi:hypothetical protein